MLRDVDGFVETVELELVDGRITNIYAVRNPEKLHHIGGARGRWSARSRERGRG